MSRVSHPNVLALRHFALNDDHLYILYDPTGRGSLEDVLLSRRFPLSETIKNTLLSDLLSGVAHLHTQSRIGFHGNLNPRTCMITDTWILKLSGFGYNKFVEDTNPFPQVGPFDSRAFCAPECFPAGYLESKEEMRRADIYRLVIVLNVNSDTLQRRLDYLHADASEIAIRSIRRRGTRGSLQKSSRR